MLSSVNSPVRRNSATRRAAHMRRALAHEILWTRGSRRAGAFWRAQLKVGGALARWARATRRERSDGEPAKTARVLIDADGAIKGCDISASRAPQNWQSAQSAPWLRSAGGTPSLWSAQCSFSLAETPTKPRTWARPTVPCPATISAIARETAVSNRRPACIASIQPKP